MLRHHARLREGPKGKSSLPVGGLLWVCVGALGRGLRELCGFTEAAERMLTQRALKLLDQARVICLL